MIGPMIAVSLLPVLLFLLLLILLDSYKLVSPRSVGAAIAAGGVAAIGCLYLNRWLLGGVPAPAYTRYVAPLLEEAAKALYVVFLVRGKRVGFLVDAAIYGFAVGTGFALVENVDFLRAFGPASLFLWVVRGFGTAVMHGSTTSIFAILCKMLTDRHGALAPHLAAPGLGAAAAIHSAYNHLILPPLATTGLLLAVLPLLVVVVFERSERATRHWLGVGFDTDADLLDQILTGEVRETRVGAYLESLKSRFPGTVVADMLCLLRVRLELSMRAKGMLLARQAGLKVPIDEQVRASLEELRFLERSVGKTGRLAILPFVNQSARDLWELYLLGGEGSYSSGKRVSRPA